MENEAQAAETTETTAPGALVETPQPETPITDGLPDNTDELKAMIHQLRKEAGRNNHR